MFHGAPFPSHPPPPHPPRPPHPPPLFPLRDSDALAGKNPGENARKRNRPSCSNYIHFDGTLGIEIRDSRGWKNHREPMRDASCGAGSVFLRLGLRRVQRAI